MRYQRRLSLWRLLILVDYFFTNILTINSKNSPSSVGGEMNCNKNEKNTCSTEENVL